MIRLYRAEIHLLHESRERWVQEKLAAFPARRDLLQSRQYQVIAQQRVNLLQRLSSEIV
jgi:hypothetical protein